MDPLEALESLVPDARKGLPEEVFLLLTRLTPMINVDLLIRDGEGRSLLTWRADTYYPAGWHVPGGIIRYKETAAQRLHAVAHLELGARIRFESEPLAIREVIQAERKNRGHFISMLYACTLETPPDPAREWHGGEPLHGEWAWHQGCPERLLEVHGMYRPFLR
nr:NUDIX domain-containing protein [uncultured Holophaga sp.]